MQRQGGQKGDWLYVGGRQLRAVGGGRTDPAQRPSPLSAADGRAGADRKERELAAEAE